MTVQTITLHLPQDIFRRLQHMAEVTHRPLEDVVFQAIRGNLPPSVDDLPSELCNESVSLQNLSDEALWAVAREPLPADRWRRHEHLLYKNRVGTLTDAEWAELARLRTATDHFVFRRSYALALLKWRGYTLPISESLAANVSTSKNPNRRSPAGS